MKKRILAILLTVVLTLGLLPAAAAEGTFSDVPTTYWGYDYIEAAAEAGLMKGTGGGKFSPELKVSVAQFLTLLGRLVFPDVKADGEDWYGPYVRAAKEAGLLTGSKVDVNNVENEITRYDMAVILCAAAKKLGVTEKTAQPGEVADYMDIPARYIDAVLAVYGTGLIKGDQTGNFNGENTMTRVEVATVIARLLAIQPGEATPEQEVIEPETSTPETSTPSSSGSGTGQKTAEPDLEGARKAIIKCLSNMEPWVDMTPYHISMDESQNLVNEVLSTDPAGYFVFTYGGVGSADGVALSQDFRYYGTRKEFEEYKQEVKALQEKANKIVDSIVTDNMSDYEIAKALHDYLVLNVEYNKNWLEDIRNPNSKLRRGKHVVYLALTDHLAVCAGYSATYKYLMDLAGVPCEYITGDSDGTDEMAAELGYGWSVSHAWNIVQIDGEWYHVDVTWDDLGGDNIRYDYFLKSDKALRGHYDWDTPHACTSTKYDGMTGTENDQQQAEREEKRKAEIMADFMARFNTLPYRSAEGLTGTDELSDEELLSYSEDKVYYPMDQYTYEEMSEIYFAVINSENEQVFQLNRQFMEDSYEDDQWYLVVFRYDVWEEYYRRNPQFRPQS